MPMLTMNRMEFVLDDLLSTGGLQLAATRTGELYLPDVLRLQAAITGIRTAQEAPTGPGEKAALKETADRHQGQAVFIDTSIKGLKVDPSQKQSVRDAAAEAQAKIFPKPPSVRMTPIARVDAAQALAPLVDAHAHVLKLLPAAGGGNLLDRARAYLACAEELGQLVAREAHAAGMHAGASEDGSKRRSTVAVVSEAMNLLKSMRVTLTAEVRQNPELPRDLVSRVFGLYDQSLAESRAPKRSVRAPAESIEAKVEGAAA